MNAFQWLQQNWLWVFTVWAGVDIVLAPVANAVPPTSWAGKALHVFLAIGPADVLTAWKKLGASTSPPTGGAS